MILALLKIVAVSYFVIIVAFYFLQSRMLFQSTKGLDRTPNVYEWAYESVRLDVGEHITTGWWIPYGEDSKGVILFSHGNAGNMAGRLESVFLFRKMGFDVLVYDYGGYGESTGASSEGRCYADIRAMYDWLTEEKAIPAERIVLFGRSLGGGVTSELAQEVKVAAVIVESTFKSVSARAQEIFPFLPAKLIVKNRFENHSKIDSFLSPVLIVHSPDDTLIPFHHGRALFDAATEPKSFLEISGDHNEGFWKSGDLYTQGLTDFLQPLLPDPTPKPAE